MKTYEIRVNNAVVESKALNEWSAMKQLGIFKEIGDMIDYLQRKGKDGTLNAVWIYQVELNGQTTLAYVKRTA